MHSALIPSKKRQSLHSAGRFWHQLLLDFHSRHRRASQRSQAQKEVLEMMRGTHQCQEGEAEGMKLGSDI